MRPPSTLWGLTAAAGLGLILALFAPATAARAQYSYGYDSLAYEPTAQTYYYNSGYQSVYTNPSTGAYVNGSAVAETGIAPFAPPPYRAFPRGDALPAGPRPPSLMLRPSAVSAYAEPAPQSVNRSRRGLILRRRR